MPDVRRHFMCCKLDSTIYLIGGFGKHRIIQSSVKAFNTTTGMIKFLFVIISFEDLICTFYNVENEWIIHYFLKLS